MSDRDNDFRRLVPMLPGWTVSEPDGNLVKSLRAFRRADYASFGFPAPDDPFSSHTEFVGKLADCIGRGWSLEAVWRAWVVETSPLNVTGWRVKYAEQTGHGRDKTATGEASDLAWAAVKAALACRTVKP